MKVLVTGGGGFLGQAVVRRLLERGDAVRVLNRSSYPELAAQGADCLQGDLGDAEAVRSACQGCDAVVHIGARAGPGLYWPDFERANVTGTQNVLASCRAERIRTLVYTSSPSVVHAGGDIAGSDETLPYPARFPAPYPATKARAEQRVLAANGGLLKTVALRPHLIWGPGDNHLLPRLIERNRAGRLRLPAPEKKIDTVYIDNAAEAHLLALDDLAGPARTAGKAYFISNGEPLPVAEIMRRLLEAVGETPRIRSMPLAVAKAAAAMVEPIWRGLQLKYDPPISRFMVEQLSTAHWFDISSAGRDLEYRPAVSIEEGLRRLARAAASGQ